MNIKAAYKKAASAYAAASRKLYIGATNMGGTAVMLTLGTVILAVGLNELATAQTVTSPGQITTQERFSELVNRGFNLIEGNLGALIMVAAGLAAIVSAAFGAYRAAISLLAVAVGAFILRSLVGIFFNFQNAQ